MSPIQERPPVDHILHNLKDFQRKTVDYVFKRLFTDTDCVDRFLIADEVGLGKTLVARGVIAKAIDYTWDDIKRIDIVYVCANADIARQNINRLNITGKEDFAYATRLTLLPTKLHNLQNNKLNFVSFTPKTSFDLRSQAGIVHERILLYHMLRKGWGFGGSAGPKNIFQCDVGKETWRWHLNNFDEQINDELLSLFLKALESDPTIKERFKELSRLFCRHKKKCNVSYEDRIKQREFVGDLRKILARTCMGALEPDIIILDEFQRFKYLLDGEDEVASLAQALFNYKDESGKNVKVILLSATPYKMYTTYAESEEDDHYADFIRTTKFLFSSDEETESFKKELLNYKKHLYAIDNKSEDLLQSKDLIEKRLRKVMVRTERLSVTADRDGMVEEARGEVTDLTSQDLQTFSTIDRLSKVLDVGDSMEYWKSAPYLLNTMEKEGYKIKKNFDYLIENNEQIGELIKILKDQKNGLLFWDNIDQYNEIDLGNAKLRLLVKKMIDSGAWQLLWIPPSLPYYDTQKSPYNQPGIKAVTKAIIFSAWQVVPKIIAMMCSYEADRRTQSIAKTKVNYREERKKRAPLLRFAFAENRLTGMVNFTLLYPCFSLATFIDPCEISARFSKDNKLPNVSDIQESIAKEIEKLLQPIISKYNSKEGQTDEKWYWAALAMLDSHYFPSSQISDWLKSEDEIAWKYMVAKPSDEEGDTHFANHVDSFAEAFDEKSLELGKPPKDLINVLTKVALASPAVVCLRSLLRFMNAKDNKQPDKFVLAEAARMALGFRVLFNQPESMIIVRSISETGEIRYWENVLDYAVLGNLQSSIDEYCHILLESLGLTDKPAAGIAQAIAEELYSVLSIRTVNYGFDEYIVNNDRRKIETQRYTMRCKFALRFGDSKSEEEEEVRGDQVRRAFNSPFRPFILATTSIGQEGLDFHQYCHSIYHWNLPSNPVDFEQREGRIHRYKCHFIRRNVALAFPLSKCSPSRLSDPWAVIFKLAAESRGVDKNDLIPYWIYEVENGFKIYRHILSLPFSRDAERMESLRKSLAVYRLAFGQPRQEDLVKFLQSHFENKLSIEDLNKYKIDLSPSQEM